MRRAALLVLTVSLVLGVVVAAGARDRERGASPASESETAVDPGVAARRARDLALVGPLLVTLVAGGQEVARARVLGNRAEVAAVGLTGIQEGGRLDALGTSVEVAAADLHVLLGPLVDRPARWEGRHLLLDGDPPARAWLDDDGRLNRLEVDLAPGGLLVVTPAG